MPPLFVLYLLFFTNFVLPSPDTLFLGRGSFCLGIKKKNSTRSIIYLSVIVHYALNLLIFIFLPTVVSIAPFWNFLLEFLHHLFLLFRTLKAFKAMNLSLSTALPMYTSKCSDDALWLVENIGLGGSKTFIRILPLIISWPWASVSSIVKWGY